MEFLKQNLYFNMNNSDSSFINFSKWFQKEQELAQPEVGNFESVIKLYQLTIALSSTTLISRATRTNFTVYTPNSTVVLSNIINSVNDTSSVEDLYSSPWAVQFVWSLLFGSMISVGLVANLLVMVTISGHRSLHTVTNCFLLNLTLGDLITLLLNATFNFVFMLTGHWPFGRVYCVVNNFVTNLTIAISVFTIMVTSKERYVAIVHPLRERMKFTRALLYIGLIWLGGGIFALPALIFSRTVHIRYPNGPLQGQIMRTACILLWPDGYPVQSRFDFIYNVAFLVLTYFLPLMTMAIAYALMARVLWGTLQIGESTQGQINLINSKRKVVRMLMCVVVVFAVCWLPYHIYFVCTYVWPRIIEVSGIQHIYLAIYWLAMSNSMLNPIILLSMNQRFRRYSTKYLNFWPARYVLSLDPPSPSIPLETCNTSLSVTPQSCQRSLSRSNSPCPTMSNGGYSFHTLHVLGVPGGNEGEMIGLHRVNSAQHSTRHYCACLNVTASCSCSTL